MRPGTWCHNKININIMFRTSFSQSVYIHVCKCQCGETGSTGLQVGPYVVTGARQPDPNILDWFLILILSTLKVVVANIIRDFDIFIVSKSRTGGDHDFKIIAIFKVIHVSSMSTLFNDEAVVMLFLFLVNNCHLH